MSRNRNDRKPQRRLDAAARQAEWDALSSVERLARIEARVGPDATYRSAEYARESARSVLSLALTRKETP